MKYRREIDGLRAIAVLPVIFFHAGFDQFSGGFVGVDVFFVISGYLITSLLISDIERKNFSILNFYERRALRILPALFIVMIACTPFAYAWMFPIELKNFFQSLVAVSLFSSNFLFWLEEGYFAPSAELKPLLHTWSLAVEEQYYLIFPIFLITFWKLGRKKVFWIISFLALSSLLFSEWGWRNFPSANFYLAPSRAFELLAGSLCAFIIFYSEIRRNNFFSFLGLILILFSVFSFNENTPFPSFYALVPVLGTSLIILFSREDTIISKILSTKFFVGIGLISYSAYLWHQPLFAFARLRSITEPSELLMISLALLSLILAWITWSLVEQPFRKRKFFFLKKQKKVFSLSFAFILLFGFIGFYGHLNEGFKNRSNGDLLIGSLDERLDKNYGLHKDCESLLNDSKITSSENCFTSDAPDVLLWGDSHAMHLVQGIRSSEASIGLQQHTLSSCAPIIGIAPILTTENLARKCILFNQSVFEWIKKSNVKIVILSSLFSGILDKNILQDDGSILKNNKSINYISQKLKQTIRDIQSLGVKVITVSTTPRSGWDNGRCIIRSVYFKSSPDSCDFKLDKEIDGLKLLENIEADFPVYWLYEDICESEVCDTIKKDVFIFKDKTHLSKEGSHFLGKQNKWASILRQNAR